MADLTLSAFTRATSSGFPQKRIEHRLLSAGVYSRRSTPIFLIGPESESAADQPIEPGSTMDREISSPASDHVPPDAPHLDEPDRQFLFRGELPNPHINRPTATAIRRANDHQRPALAFFIQKPAQRLATPASDMPAGAVSRTDHAGQADDRTTAIPGRSARNELHQPVHHACDLPITCLFRHVLPQINQIFISCHSIE